MQLLNELNCGSDGCVLLQRQPNEWLDHDFRYALGLGATMQPGDIREVPVSRISQGWMVAPVSGARISGLDGCA